MKFLPLILATLMLANAGTFAAAGGTFEKAQTAYDNGKYAEAASLYETLLSNGVSNVEVYYNLGNAYFKNGNLPQAVWNYRKAWYKTPRDPDIQANLHFALNAAGAVEPAPGFIERSLTSLSSREWSMVATGGYLAMILVFILAVLIRKARATLIKLTLLPIAILILAAGGLWQWRQFQRHPECVVKTAGTTALYGPVEGGTEYYKLPLAALATQLETEKGWVEIRYDGKAGWIKEDNILHLSP